MKIEKLKGVGVYIIPLTCYHKGKIWIGWISWVWLVTL